MEKNAILKDVKLWHLKILNLQITSQHIGLQGFGIRSSLASGLQQSMPRSTNTRVRQIWERWNHWEEATSVNHSAFSHQGNFLQQSSTLWLGLSWNSWNEESLQCQSHVPMVRRLSESKQTLMHPTVIGSTEDTTFNYLLFHYSVILQ